MDVSILFVTVGKAEEASMIARTLVTEKLVACVNMVPQIQSIYWWKGEVCEDAELLLIMKTRSALVDAVQKRVKELHSYEVPEVIAIPIAQGLPAYLSWVVESTVDAKGS
jgi:periplasmic divalent cation tolerance protein